LGSDQTSPTTAPASTAPEAIDGQSTSPAPAQLTPATPQKPPDKAAAYYHFMMAHMYEEMVSMYGRSDYATKAVDEYRAAIDNDPSSDYLNAARLGVQFRQDGSHSRCRAGSAGHPEARRQQPG